MTSKEIIRYFSDFTRKFSGDNTTTWAASLAFYTILSLAPLLILFVVASVLIGPDLQNRLLGEANAMVGPDAAMTVETVIKNAQAKSGVRNLSGVLGLVTLFISASLVFVEIRNALNHFFRFKLHGPKTSGFFATVWHWVKTRLFHMGLSLIFICSLIASLIASSVISALIREEPIMGIRVLNISLSLLFYTGLFSFVFRYLPTQRMRWRLALRGGLITSALFIIGKEFLAAYLSSSALGSAYGAAGSVVLLLVWVYYSALIIFVGAQFTALSLLSSRSKWQESKDSYQNPAA